MKYFLTDGLEFNPPFLFTPDKVLVLSKSYSRVLEILVADESGIPLSTELIGLNLWGNDYYDMKAPRATVRAHIKGLRDQLRGGGVPHLVGTFKGHGYIYIRDERIRAAAT